MDYINTHTIIHIVTKHASVRNHVSTSTTDGPNVCFKSKFMVTTGHDCMNKFHRNAFLLNMEETLAQ
jgi:hypothetical protein